MPFSPGTLSEITSGQVLLADASEPLGTRLEVLLRDSGYDVLRTHDGHGARACHGDVVLLHADLPGGDPLALASHWAAEHIPVVMLGGPTDVEAKIRGFESGVIDFVSYPIDGREMVARVKRHLTVARMRHALRQSEAHFRSVTESAVDAIISADAQGRILAWNRAAEAILGWSVAEAVGQPLEIIIPERFLEPHRAGIARINRGDPSRVIGHTVELFARHRNGHELPIELSLATWTLGTTRFLPASCVTSANGAKPRCDSAPSPIRPSTRFCPSTRLDRSSRGTLRRNVSSGSVNTRCSASPSR